MARFSGLGNEKDVPPNTPKCYAYDTWLYKKAFKTREFLGYKATSCFLNKDL